MNTLITEVRAHARKNYGHGWDYVVECYADSDILEIVQEAGAKTPEEAVAAVGKVVGIQDDFRKDIEATVW